MKDPAVQALKAHSLPSEPELLEPDTTSKAYSPHPESENLGVGGCMAGSNIGLYDPRYLLHSEVGV